MTASEAKIPNEAEESIVKMSFLEHLDELRKRLMRSILVVFLAFIFCWTFSDVIYEFLSVPVRKALTEAEQRDLPVVGLQGNEEIYSLDELKDGQVFRYVFDRKTRVGNVAIAAGTTVLAKKDKDSSGTSGLFSDEALIVGRSVIPEGIRLPSSLDENKRLIDPTSERMIVTTAVEPFTLYVTVSLYAAIALSIPFLLWQIWGFISPALYRHERKYVTPFIFLSTVAFLLGASFAYYILFPPAIAYLLGVGQDFDLMLRASDYFDFIVLIMLAMGIIFQMPAVSYVLSRIGIISAPFLIKGWKIALVVILIVAAVISPTGDVPNLLLFALPMTVLYVISIFIAWLFGKERRNIPKIQ
jgi:sec-independent protein translocase protein TatC